MVRQAEICSWLFFRPCNEGMWGLGTLSGPAGAARHSKTYNSQPQITKTKNLPAGGPRMEAKIQNQTGKSVNTRGKFAAAAAAHE